VDSEILLWLSGFLVVVVIALVILLFMERERKKPLIEEPVKPHRSEAWAGFPPPIRKTITTDLVKEARDKLRILSLEREILSYAVRRLYEASAEGKITDEERDRLVLKYKEDLARVKEEIARGESIVALNELERMQEEFVKLFSERFEELNRRIEELKTLSGFAFPEPEEPAEPEEPVEEEKKEEKAEAPKQPVEKKPPPKTRRRSSKPKAPPEPEKTDAEKKVEQIVAEVEKVLKKLGQMEVEE